jgi:hypothetical protein
VKIFYRKKLCLDLRTNINELDSVSEMKTAGILDKNALQSDKLFRNDNINRIQAESINPFENIYKANIFRFITY